MLDNIFRPPQRKWRNDFYTAAHNISLFRFSILNSFLEFHYRADDRRQEQPGAVRADEHRHTRQPNHEKREEQPEIGRRGHGRQMRRRPHVQVHEPHEREDADEDGGWGDLFVDGSNGTKKKSGAATMELQRWSCRRCNDGVHLERQRWSCRTARSSVPAEQRLSAEQAKRWLDSCPTF